MNNSRLEWKVGIFVVLSLAIAAALIMKFSKGASLFTQTYELLLVTSNVGGIRQGANVLVAGVQVGTVKSIDLGEGGKTVTMHTQILSRYHIPADSLFTIEQAGFLGDQYISVTPGPNPRPVLRPGAVVKCQEPFNLQEVARSASGLLKRFDETAARLNHAVARIDETLLAEETLTNLTGAVINFRHASERALATLDGVDRLIETNSVPLNTAISNLVQFSEQLDAVTAELQLAVATNRVELTIAVKNIEAGTVYINTMLRDLQEGKGLAGSLLRDRQMQEQFASMMANLSMVSSNLNRHNLFWNFFGRRPAAAEPAQPNRR